MLVSQDSQDDQPSDTDVWTSGLYNERGRGVEQGKWEMQKGKENSVISGLEQLTSFCAAFAARRVVRAELVTRSLPIKPEARRV